jgi:hypothetical protein
MQVPRERRLRLVSEFLLGVMSLRLTYRGRRWWPDLQGTRGHSRLGSLEFGRPEWIIVIIDAPRRLYEVAHMSLRLCSSDGRGINEVFKRAASVVCELGE